MSPDESFETKPIGTGYLGWLLDKKPALRLNEGLEYALSQGIRNIWLSFGDDLSKWCRFVKSKEPRAKVFVIVSNVEEGEPPLVNNYETSRRLAGLAAVDFGADVLIVQGTEAGGHGSSKGMPLLSFLPTMIQALPERRPHLVAAGGIASRSPPGLSGIILKFRASGLSNSCCFGSRRTWRRDGDPLSPYSRIHVWASTKEGCTSRQRQHHRSNHGL